MPRIIYIEHSGTKHEIDVPAGTSVMQGAFMNSIPGIDGDCGGECACGTCHVYVDLAWVEKVGAQRSREIEMLSFAAAAEANSRLSCQIEVTPLLDGLVVRLPDGQH